MKKKLLSLTVITIFLFCLLQFSVMGLPAAVIVSDTIQNDVEDLLHLNSDNISIDIGPKQSPDAVRYAEIDGVQTRIEEINNKFFVPLGDENVLVEIVEKVDVDSADVVKTQYFYVDMSTHTSTKLEMDSFMKSYDETSIRVQNSIGVRFKSHALVSAKNENVEYIIDEYGYLVAVEEALGDEELTFDFSKYVQGVGYDREKGIDIIFDSSDDVYDIFTGVLKNVPVRNYKTGLVCKTYTKLTVNGNQFTVYGEPVKESVFNAAKKAFALENDNIAVADILFDYYEYDSSTQNVFSDSSVDVVYDALSTTVSGAFNYSGNEDLSYNVYLVSYDDYGGISNVETSAVLYAKNGNNTFTLSFNGPFDSANAKVYVLTKDFALISMEAKTVYSMLEWKPESVEFYDTLTLGGFNKNTDFSKLFQEDCGVTLIEGMTIASNLHAKYYRTEVTERVNPVYNYVLEMDDTSVLVDLSERNSINIDGINFVNADGGIDENEGYLYATSVINSKGRYDPQINIKGLNLDARKYNRITVRMKLEKVDGGSATPHNENAQIFFATSSSGAYSESKSVVFNLKKISNVYDWFEFTVDLDSDADWKDLITSIRFDPINCNAKFYVDYIKLSNVEGTGNDNWYDVYLDYAIDNGIISLGQYLTDDYYSEITREDFFSMIMPVYSENFFATINDIDALPDIGKNDRFSELYLLLYKAGITLGFDENGNLCLDENIKRSQVTAIINRLLVPSNRLIGTVDASWDSDSYQYDAEFNSPSDLNLFTYRATVASKEVKDGSLVIEGKYDSGFYKEGISISADEYTKLRVRIKADYTDTPNDSGKTATVFFKPKEGFDGYLDHYSINQLVTNYYLDPLGWYVFEIDLSLHSKWKGDISYFRFDPMNSPGTYTIDYIRFIKSEYADLPTQEDLIDAGYIETRLMQDEHFERGFYVSKVDQSVSAVNHGLWQDYCDTSATPLWQIGPWWQGTGDGFKQVDLWDDRDTTTDEYTLADKYGVNTIVYNPELKSITQRLNAANIYNGEPHDVDTYKWWPHQLLEQNTVYTGEVDKDRNSADADRMFVELDVRMTDFKNTTNVEGRNACQYLIYFYLRPKAQPNQRIWFGLNLFTTSATTDNPIGLTAPTNVKPGWSPDSAAHQYMYGMPMAVVYNGIENSFNPAVGVADASDEWKKIRLDVTPHIDRAVEWANRDNIFGMQVTKEDMYFDGVNIGYEIHGNYDVTFEFKNFNIVSYNKP